MEGQGQAQEQGRTGVFGRIIGTFLSPGETFASVRASSSWVDWVVPWVIGAILAGVIAWKVTPIAMRETWESQREHIQQNANLSDEQKKEALTRIEKMEARGASFAGTMTVVMVPVGSLIVLAILSGIYLGIANFVFGGTGTFMTMMAVTAYSGLIGTLGGLIKLPLILMKNTGMVAMGPALFFPPDMAHTWAYRLASGVDIFWIWYLAVGAIGAGVVSGVAPKKICAVVFAIYLIVIVGAAVFKNAVGM